MTQAIQKSRRKGLLEKMAEKYSLEPAKFWEGVKATIAPSKKDGSIATDAEIMAFLMVAYQYNLNPFIREIYGFVGKGGKVQVVIPIDGWIKVVNREPLYGGFEQVDILAEDGKLEAIKTRMRILYNKDEHDDFRNVEMTEYMNECKIPGKEPWDKWPARMLRHKSFIQCARYAFGISGAIDPDEADRIEAAVDITPGAELMPKTKQLASGTAGGPGDEKTPATPATPEPEPAEPAKPAPEEKKPPAEYEKGTLDEELFGKASTTGAKGKK